MYIGYNTQNEDKQNTQHKHRKLTNNQEWTAVNIGYTTQNEDKQNTQHKHRKPTKQS
jgi:hypothetical protein